MSGFQKKDNDGIISKNDRKEKDTHPDIKGSATINGREFWISGWKKDRKDGSGSFYSLSFTAKDEQRSGGGSGGGGQRPSSGFGSGGGGRQSGGQWDDRGRGGGGFEDDAIPF